MIEAPKGYELAPVGHVMRQGIDLIGYDCDAPVNGKVPPQGFTWVKGYDGMIVSDRDPVSGCFRPIVKIPYKQNRITIKVHGEPRRITIPKGYARLNKNVPVVETDQVYSNMRRQFEAPFTFELNRPADDFLCAIRKVK